MSIFQWNLCQFCIWWWWICGGYNVNDLLITIVFFHGWEPQGTLVRAIVFTHQGVRFLSIWPHKTGEYFVTLCFCFESGPKSCWGKLKSKRPIRVCALPGSRTTKRNNNLLISFCWGGPVYDDTFVDHMEYGIVSRIPLRKPGPQVTSNPSWLPVPRAELISPYYPLDTLATSPTPSPKDCWTMRGWQRRRVSWGAAHSLSLDLETEYQRKIWSRYVIGTKKRNKKVEREGKETKP